MSSTFEKQAPMWTLGVGGSPFDIGLGGVLWRLGWLRSLRGGGTGGLSVEDEPLTLFTCDPNKKDNKVLECLKAKAKNKLKELKKN